jgi:hypothetical protein
MALDLQDKRVLVVGAGAYVLAAGRPGPKLVDAIAAEVGGKAVAFDILDNAAIEAFFARTTAFDHVVIAMAATKAGSLAACRSTRRRRRWTANSGAPTGSPARPKSWTAARSPSCRAFSRTGRAPPRCCRAQSTPRSKRSAAAWSANASKPADRRAQRELPLRVETSGSLLSSGTGAPGG